MLAKKIRRDDCEEESGNDIGKGGEEEGYESTEITKDVEEGEDVLYLQHLKQAKLPVPVYGYGVLSQRVSANRRYYGNVSGIKRSHPKDEPTRGFHSVDTKYQNFRPQRDYPNNQNLSRQRVTVNRLKKNNPLLLVPVPTSVQWLPTEGLQNDVTCMRETLKKNMSISKQLHGKNSGNTFSNLFAPADILNLRTVIDLITTFTKEEFTMARGSVNPFELLKKSIFVNRAAVKLANIDTLCGLIAGTPRGSNFNFADLCAGPGGFSSYLIWRAKKIGINIRGFCITSSSDIDIDQSVIKEYGSNLSITNGDNGDITNIDNIIFFCQLVMDATNNIGVNLVTSDGSPHFETWEPNKECLIFKLCICQAITALKILKDDGTFVMKIFDIQKEYTVSFVWILSKIFKKFTIFKPQTSRSTSLERYLVFKGFISTLAPDVSTYFISVLYFLNNDKPFSNGETFSLLADPNTILQDKLFVDYVSQSDNDIYTAYNGSVRKLNFARFSKFSIGSLFNQALIAKTWLEILDLPPA